MTYSVLSCELVADFRLFQFPFFPIKMVNHYIVYLIFRILNINCQKESFITFFFIPFYEISIILKKAFHPFKFIQWKLCVAQPYKLFPSPYLMMVPLFYQNLLYICYKLLHTDNLCDIFLL